MSDWTNVELSTISKLYTIQAMSDREIISPYELAHDNVSAAFLASPFDWEVFISSDGDIRHISPEVEKFIGYSSNEFYSRNELLVEILHPDDQDYFQTHLKGDQKYLLCSSSEFCLIHKDGTKLYVDYTCSPVRNEEETFLGRWAKYRVLNESERITHYNWKSIEVWNTIIEQLPDIITIIDQRGRIIFTNSKPVNPSVQSNSIGKCVYEYIVPDQRHIAQKTIQKVVETGKSDHYEIASIRSGKKYWYMTRVGLVKQENHEPMIALVIRDITERKSAEEAINRLNEELEHRVEERTGELQRSKRFLQQRAYYLEHSERINALLRQSENRKEVLDIIVNFGMAALKADLAGVFLQRNGILELATTNGLSVSPPANLSLDENNLVYHLVYDKQTVTFLPSLEEDGSDGLCSFCNFLHHSGMYSLAVAPLRTTNALLGFLYLAYVEPRKFSADDRQILSVVAESGGNTLHRIHVMERLEEHIANREKDLSVLYDLMAITSETVELKEMLELSLVTILSVIPCSMGMIHLKSENGQMLQLAVKVGVSPELVNWFDASFVPAKMASEERRQDSSLFRMSIDEKDLPNRTGGQNMVFYAADLRVQEKNYGTLSIFIPGNCLITEANENLIHRTAHLLGIAVESTMLRQKNQETLIIEERQRLARNMHDSVTQYLYGLVLSADVSHKRVERGDFSKLKLDLEEIGETALQALREMRLLLFELKPLALESEGLVKALNLRLEAVEQRAGIHSDFQVQGEKYLPPYLESEIYRITTEALNNSIKHAAPDHVVIRLKATPNLVKLTIEDDGKGFDLDNVGVAGIGLVSMRERANSIGGELSIRSKPGKGTHIILTVVPHKREV